MQLQIFLDSYKITNFLSLNKLTIPESEKYVFFSDID